MHNNHEILICPSCQNSSISLKENKIFCNNCNKEYLNDFVPLMFEDNSWDEKKQDVTKQVQDFYETTPFPNYEGIESINDLVKKAETGFYAKFLNEQIPFNAKVLEVGCGTGQLANYLGLASRKLYGTDICLHSLKLAEKFRLKNNISNTNFFQMNLFKPIFQEKSFDLVICQGVLHHTSDPYQGFMEINKLVKPGGYIIIGLYNQYGRYITDIRRFLFNITKDKFKFFDPRLKKEDRGFAKRNAWFKDQYKHPHESKHTIGEVLKWFDNHNIEFINSIPKTKLFTYVKNNEKLFKKNQRGNFLDHFLVQLYSIIDGYREGGLFIMIGRKNV